jgi:hypothetical protein
MDSGRPRICSCRIATTSQKSHKTNALIKDQYR